MGHSYISFLLCVMIYTHSMKAVASMQHEDSFCTSDEDCEGESQVNMDAPIQFIIFAEDGKLSVSSEALEVLNSITKPITVVAIAGLYRTGKSYIMNRIFGKSKGFAVGGTLQSKTQGIWMWIRVHPSDNGRYLILLDTEGLGDFEKEDEKRDTIIFSLALLLSNCFIYKSIGTIDQQAISQLHFISELTEHIKVKSSGEKKMEDTLEGYFPTFVWILRDFSLEKIIDGKNVSSDEYLEHALKLKPGDSKRVKDFNLPRDSLKRIFRKRRCFTLPRPCSEEKLKKLEDLPDEEINEEYLNELGQIKAFINSHVGASMFHNKPINGRILGGLAEKYVEAIVNGGVPCIETAFKTISTIECEKAKETGINKYKEEMNKNARPKFPTTFEILESAHNEAFLKACEIFDELAVFDKNHVFRKQFQEGLDVEFRNLQKDNIDASTKKCEKLLQNLYDPIKTKIENGEYSSSGGYTKYIQDKQDIITTYTNIENKGLEADAALTKFNEDKFVLEMQILKSDNEFNRIEKDNIEKNAQLQVALQMQEFYKQQQAQFDRMKRAIDETHRYHYEQTVKKETPGCFAGTSVLRVKGSDGAIHTKMILDLNVGDMVESFDPESHRIVFSEVYFIAHDDNSTGNVIDIHVNCHKEFTKIVSLDDNHLIYVTNIGESIINSTSVRTPIEAQSVRIGDYLWVRQDANSLLPCQVVAIKGRYHVVVRHPMTMNHYIIVDDILASVHMFYEKTYRMITSPLRMIYRINPPWCKSRFLKWVVGLWDGVEEWFPSFTHTMAIQSMNLRDFWGSTSNVE